MNKICSLLLMFLVCSCTHNPIEFGDIKSFKIEKFENNTLQGKVEIEIINSGSFDLEIETGELHAFSDKTDLGTVKLLNPLLIEGNSCKIYPLSFSVDITNREAGMFSLLGRLAGKKPVYSLQGTVNARSFMFNKKITFNEVLEK